MIARRRVVGNADLMLLGSGALFQRGEMRNRLRQDPVGMQYGRVQADFVQQIASLGEGRAAVYKRSDKTGLLAPYKNPIGRIQQADDLKLGPVEILPLRGWLQGIQFRPEPHKQIANRSAEVGLELGEFCRV